MMAKKINFYTVLLVFLAYPLFPLLYLFLYLKKIKNKDLNNRSLHILLIPQFTRIGDIVCATPAFKALREKFPDAKISVMVSKKAAGILSYNTRIDEVILLEDYKKRNFIFFLHRIWKGSFDVGVSFSGTATSSMLFLFGLIPRRIKLVKEERTLLESLSDIFNTDLMLYRNHSFAPGFYLKMLEPLGVRAVYEKGEVFRRVDDDKNVRDYLKTKNIFPDDFVVGMSITAGNKIKEWGDDKFAVLARNIISSYRAKVVVIGSSSDRERIENFISETGKRESCVAATHFTLEELPSLISCFNLFIAVDTGPIYIAHALDVPLIDIVGPVDPSEQPPTNNRSVLVLPPGGLKPSSFVFKKPGKKEEHERAITSITPAMVLEKVAFIMGSI